MVPPVAAGGFTLTTAEPSQLCFFVFNVEFNNLSQQHSGVAMVLRWSAHIHPRLLYAASYSRRLGGLARRSGEEI